LFHHDELRPSLPTTMAWAVTLAWAMTLARAMTLAWVMALARATRLALELWLALEVAKAKKLCRGQACGAKQANLPCAGRAKKKPAGNIPDRRINLQSPGGSTAQIGLFHFGIVLELLGRARGLDLAGVQDIAPVGEIERDLGVLLD